MQGRPRVLFYGHTRIVSGAERMLLTMVEVLGQEPYELMAACPWSGPGDLDRLLGEHGVRVIEAPLLTARFTSNPVKLVQYIASFAKAIASFRGTIRRLAPDLLHANSVRAGIVATLATLGTDTKILWHVQDDLPQHPISSVIRQLAYRSRRCSFVAVSQATARAFCGQLPFGARMQVLYNAIDQARFPRKSTPLDPDAQAFRDELGIEPGVTLVVTVGMIHPRKSVLELVDAWAEVVPATRAHLAIVGAAMFNDDHLYEAQVHARCRELGLKDSIHFTGARSGVPAILRAADVFVLNAKVEPFGLVLLEAMSSGTPVIATATGGVPEIVTENVSGLLVPAGATELLAASIISAIEAPQALTLLAETAYRETLPRFTQAIFATQLKALYARLLPMEPSV